ncbi:lipase maturation factor family protein [Egicoccus halophilus]|uniref:Membrane protein n=1 Tax=Egicoccus halophilus TaxID=1670830 RepID=A0A8J3AD84_9ACTN|nr:lipase maturation factor family protein [Egicoccus halophilus]GGI04447.1 membrane protein [Egicoccus halophilus]
MEWMSADGYLLARELFQRGVGAVYAIAFVTVVQQWRPLLGADGLTPVPAFVARVPWRRSPSLFHWRYDDRFAAVLAWVGLGLSLAVVAGVPQRAGTPATVVVFALLFLLYLSFVNVGQVWYAFGWESILLEAGFLAMLLGGHDSPVPWPALLLVRWLLFRVEFGAGLIKWRGDRCWRELTCLDYHHETQPLPSVFSWWFHHLPAPLHKVEVAANHVTQLLLPFLLFLPQPFAGIAGVAVLATQGWLVVSGNFAWLNLVTMVLATAALPDAWLGGTGGPLGGLTPAATTDGVPAWFAVVVLLAFVVQVVLSRHPVRNLLSRAQRMNASYNPLHLVGTYGAFGSITRTRFELVVEGTLDLDPGEHSDWRTYEFRAKPTDPRRRPPQVAPYHLRLDWLLWFAAMTASPTRQHAWFAGLLERLLSGDPVVRRLLRTDPFDGRAPTAVRVRRERFRFTTPAERQATGAWWHTEAAGEVTGIVRR